MSNDRFVPPAVAEAMDRLRRDTPAPWSMLTRPLRLTLPTAGAARDVAHGLRQIPDGFLVVWSDAPVYAYPGRAWSATTAYLTSAAANVHAIVIFYTLKEQPADA